MFDLKVNPFAENVFSGTLETEPTLPELYMSESKQLLAVIQTLCPRQATFSRSAGLGAVLLSPKAGAGKTHLLARLAQEHKSSIHICRLAFTDPDKMCWSEWCRELLMSCHHSKDPQSDHTVLTGCTAFALANATGELIAEGAIPCESPATASSWLRAHSRKLFDASEADNPSVLWFQSEYDSLLPQVVKRLAKNLNIDANILTDWLDWLFRYSSLSAAESSLSERRAAQKAFMLESDLLAGIADDITAKQAVRVLGKLLTSEMPLVFAMDDLDWFYRDEASALRLARMLSEFSKWVPHSLTLISANEDTWHETFVKGLPEAIRDRLASHTITLNGIPQAMWQAFLTCRAEPSEVAADAVERVCRSLFQKHANEAAMMPRQLIRAAALTWLTKSSATELEPKKEEVNSSRPKEQPEEDPKGMSQINFAITSRDGKGTRAMGETTNSPNEGIEDDSANLWENAMGDIRSLIDSRQNKTMTANSGTSASPTAAGFPDKPQLTAEFRSFLTSLRARSDDKRDYEPQEIAESKKSGKAPGKASSDLILHGRPEEEEVEPSIQPNLRKKRAVAPWVCSRMREVKASMIGSDHWNRIHLEKLRPLVIKGGEQFPAVKQDLNGTQANPLDICWHYQKSEVHFGFEPYSNETFWKKLVQNTAARAREVRETIKMRVKLVVFQRAGEELSLPSWSDCDFQASDLQFCDTILLTDTHLFNLYAAEQLLIEESNEQWRDEIFKHLSGELDFFWKMITRPVWTVVPQFSKGPSSVAP